MTVRENRVVEPTPDQFEDEFGPYLEEAKQDPAFRAAYEDAEERHRIIDKLVGLRRALGLSQTAVAQRMNVRQPTVSQFETEGSDPRLSTLQRYARAVTARLRFVPVIPSECDWISTSTVAYRPDPVRPTDGAAVCSGSLAKSWHEFHSYDQAATA